MNSLLSEDSTTHLASYIEKMLTVSETKVLKNQKIIKDKSLGKCKKFKGYQNKTFYYYNSFYKGYAYFITYNYIGAWLAYIDITDYEEIQSETLDYYLFLPFHGGCTFARLVSKNSLFDFSENRFLIGCDWNHGLSLDDFGTEKTSFEKVQENIKEVIDELDVMRLAKIIENG